MVIMKPYHKNPRKIEKVKFEELKKWLDEFGDLSGIVHDLNSNEIVSGNQRSTAFNINECEIVLQGELGEPDRQGTVAHGYVVWNGARYNYRQVRWTAEQCERANIIANKAGGDWDLEILLRDFKLTPDNSPPTGVDSAPQINRADELRQGWGTELGQLWVLPSRTAGQEHRLICGDCTDRAVVDRVMRGEMAEIMFSSPPYTDLREYSGNDLSLKTMTSIFGVFQPFCRYFVVNLGYQFEGGEINTYWDDWILAARGVGAKLLAWNVWDKINATSVSSQLKMFALQHEWIFVFGDAPKKLNRTWDKSKESEKRAIYYQVNSKGQKITTRRQPDGSVKASSVGGTYDNKNMGSVFTAYAEMSRGIREHPAMFPVDLPSAYIEEMTAEGDICIDPFSGSGTTIVAAENLSRQCRAVEISPTYVAVALQRYFDTFQIRPYLGG